MATSATTLFVAGDVMTGRGIDQILARPGDPQLFEPYVRSALTYVDIAERSSRPITRGVDAVYIWGDALAEIDRLAPAARIVNFETAISERGKPSPDKDIHYRMHPANIGCISAAAIDCCVLANDHVLDWGHQALADTLASIRGAGLKCVGAGENEQRAQEPALIETTGGRRVLVFACATLGSGVPRDWAAEGSRAGVNLIEEPSDHAADLLARKIGAHIRAGDLVVVSIHWGSNWGYQVTRSQRLFAHRLVDSGLVHLVHGHSSHHPRPIEIYRACPILYGCGDLINDYEGIGGHESYRPELALLYFPTFAQSPSRLIELRMVPLRLRRFRLERASREDARWLAETLNRESSAFGVRVDQTDDGDLLASTAR
ncbi:MAG: CapA family protein [Burkholderiaceae bacterium]|nr:CapA family protein [Burkholderiaceae bacterium]